MVFRRMAWACLVIPFLTHSWVIVAVVLDMEANMTESWLEGDWSTENQVHEEVTEDRISGCICRAKLHQHIVCYGGSCTAFPKNVTLPTGILDLRVKTTDISELLAGDLEHLLALKYLEIDANYHLSVIQPGAFRSMANLTSLSVSFNTELRWLDANVFEGLENLRRLRLIKNGFQTIGDVAGSLTPSYLPRLESLSLSENAFPIISEDAFQSLAGTNIKELDLILCQMELIHPRALRVFRRLEKLRLGENLLTEETLEELFREMHDIPLSLLNLYELGFRKGAKLTSLLDVIANTSVSHLVLSRNHLENLYQGVFPFMPNIKILDLREASVIDVETNALSEKMLPKLTVLLLGGNKLPGALPGVLLPQLAELDLSLNSGNDLLQSYFDVNTNNIFRNMTRLTSLNLSYNRIATIMNLTFNGVNNLQILGLKNATIFYIAENSFSMLKNLFLLNLEQNPFTPFNKFENLIFEGLDSLEILLLSYCKILFFSRTDIFRSLSKLKYLNLKGNDLYRLNGNLFQPLPFLVGMDISNNQLRPWTNSFRLFTNNFKLKILILSKNRFTYLTKTMMEDFYNLTRVELAENPFLCDCTSFNRTNAWMASRNITVNDTVLFNRRNLCVSPDAWRDKPLVQFLEEINGHCDLSESLNVNFRVLYATCGVLIFVFVLLSFVGYWYRWYIRYWIFLTKMAYIRHHSWLRRNHKVHPGDYKYDAFVSYSHEDRNFLVRLVAMLENHEPFLKLCVYERDFEIGTVISETVMNKVESSRRTLLIISDAFARSQWCMWELQIAEYHRLFFKNRDRDKYCDDPLIMIKLGPIADAHITPTLRYLMKTRIYLEWNPDAKKQKVFWGKLRQSLSSHRTGKRANEV